MQNSSRGTKRGAESDGRARRVAELQIAATVNPLDANVLRPLIDVMDRKSITALCSSSEQTRSGCAQFEREGYWRSRLQQECLVTPIGKSNYFHQYLASAEPTYNGRMSRLFVNQKPGGPVSVRFTSGNCSQQTSFDIVAPSDGDNNAGIMQAIADNVNYIDVSSDYEVHNIIQTASANLPPAEKVVGFTNSHRYSDDSTENVVARLNGAGHVVVTRDGSDRTYMPSLKGKQPFVSCDTLYAQSFAVTDSGVLYVFDRTGKSKIISMKDSRIVAISANQPQDTLMIVDSRGFAYLYVFGREEAPFTYRRVGYYQPSDQNMQVVGVSGNTLTTRSGGLLEVFVLDDNILSSLRRDETVNLITGPVLQVIPHVSESQQQPHAASSLTSAPYYVRVQSAEQRWMGGYKSLFFVGIDSSGRAYAGELDGQRRTIQLPGIIECFDCAAFTAQTGKILLATLSSGNRVNVFSVADAPNDPNVFLIAKLATFSPL